MPHPKIPQWSELPPELLQEIADKHTNYVDYVRTRSVCKSWEAAIPKRPNKLLTDLPILLLPYHQKTTNCHRGFYNIPDRKTYSLPLPEAIGRHCCGSSNGWLVMVEEIPKIFLLNPLTRKTINLPCLTTLPTFPTQVIFRNSMSLNDKFIEREKLQVRDTFIIKAIVTGDPSSSDDFAVVVIYGSNENLAICRPGDSSWTVVDQESRYKDVVFRGGKLLAVDQMGKVFSCDIADIGKSPVAAANAMTCMVDVPPVSSRAGYMQWYLATINQKDKEDLVLVARYRKVIPEYEYKTERFEVYKLLDDKNTNSWSKMDSLGDLVLFLGSSGSHSISAGDYHRRNDNIRGNCIYFTDDYMRIFKDYVWEGHDFGVFDFSDRTVKCLGFSLFPVDRPCFPNMFFYDQSIYRDTSVFVLPPPIWVTLSP